MNRISTLAAIILAFAFFLPHVISAQQATIVLPETKIVGKITHPSSTLHNFLKQRAIRAQERAQAIDSNSPFVSLVLFTMLSLAEDEASKKVFESYQSFFENPTSNNRLLPSARNLLDLARSGSYSAMENYVASNIYSFTAVATDNE